MLYRLALIVLLITTLGCAREKITNDSTSTSNYWIFEHADKLTVDDYNYLLDSLKKYDTTDYFSLRLAFTKTNNYNPYDIEDSKIFDRMEGYYKTQKYTDAIISIDSILTRNYVNIKAHMVAGFFHNCLKLNFDS